LDAKKWRRTLIIDFPYDGIAPVEIPDENLLGVYKPKKMELNFRRSEKCVIYCNN
jgi:hypothetical protein